MLQARILSHIIKMLLRHKQDPSFFLHMVQIKFLQSMNMLGMYTSMLNTASSMYFDSLIGYQA